MTFAIRDGIPHIGERAFPWAEKVEYTDDNNWHRRLFHLRFENGWLLSVAFGSGSYCDNHDSLWDHVDFVEEPTTAECWGWWGDSQEHWPINDGDVIGYQTADDVLALIDQMQRWQSVSTSIRVTVKGEPGE